MSDKKQQTAVEWLSLYLKGITSLNFDEIIQQAKEMEKEQIIKAHNVGSMWGFEDVLEQGEEYYNETYEKINK